MKWRHWVPWRRWYTPVFIALAGLYGGLHADEIYDDWRTAVAWNTACFALGAVLFYLEEFECTISSSVQHRR